MLQNGGNLELTRNTLTMEEEGWNWQEAETIQVGPSVQMEINPFLVNRLYEVNGQRIAYLMYNEFATGPDNEATETTYNEQMAQLFTQFKAQSPDAFILDLRYNNGGYLQCAQALGSMLVPAADLGKEFINLTFNNKQNPQTIHYLLDNQYAAANLNLSKIYILTSEMTASASEAVINGLIPYLSSENVVLIGTRTEGKNVAMTPYKNDTYGLTLYPVVAYVANAENQSQYSSGFEPQYVLDENDEMVWYPLGDPQEYLLKHALTLITTGNMPETDTSVPNSIQVNGYSIAPKGCYIKPY